MEPARVTRLQWELREAARLLAGDAIEPDFRAWLQRRIVADEAELAERWRCDGCGNPIPMGKRAEATYCSKRCGNVSRYRRGVAASCGFSAGDEPRSISASIAFAAASSAR